MPIDQVFNNPNKSSITPISRLPKQLTIVPVGRPPCTVKPVSIVPVSRTSAEAFESPIITYLRPINVPSSSINSASQQETIDLTQSPEKEVKKSLKPVVFKIVTNGALKAPNRKEIQKNYKRITYYNKRLVKNKNLCIKCKCVSDYNICKTCLPHGLNNGVKSVVTLSTSAIKVLKSPVITSLRPINVPLSSITSASQQESFDLKQSSGEEYEESLEPVVTKIEAKETLKDFYENSSRWVS